MKHKFIDIFNSHSGYVAEVQNTVDACLPRKLSSIFTFLDYMKSNVNIEKEYKVDAWADVEFLVCRSDKRVPGLGTELVRRAVGIMEERGVKVKAYYLIGCRIYDDLPTDPQ